MAIVHIMKCETISTFCDFSLHKIWGEEDRVDKRIKDEKDK